MSSTLAAYRREMLTRFYPVGQVVVPTGMAAQSVTVARLARGQSADQLINRYIVRADAVTAAAADRDRLITAFTNTTGLMTHAGPAYSDTTLTGETVELLEFKPELYDLAIQWAVTTTQRRWRTEFPTVSGQRRYTLADMTWVAAPSGVLEIATNRSPVLVHDRYIQQWNTVSSAGVLQPDWWALAGTGAAVTRSSTQTWKGNQTAAFTYGSTNATMSQAVPLLFNGAPVANGEDLRGKLVTFGGVGWASAASRFRFSLLANGSVIASTAYHTGGSSFEELTSTYTVLATAATLSVQAEINTGVTTVYVGEMYAFENDITDGIRRGAYEDSDIHSAEPADFDQGTGPLSYSIEPISRGQQLVFYTNRPFSGFDATRLAAGTADADLSDAPLVPVAVAAIGRLFKLAASLPGQDGERAQRLAAQWEDEGAKLRGQFTYVPETPRGGLDLPRPGPMLPRARSGRGRMR